jgi:hypothetical protein
VDNSQFSSSEHVADDIFLAAGFKNPKFLLVVKEGEEQEQEVKSHLTMEEAVSLVEPVTLRYLNDDVNVGFL